MLGGFTRSLSALVHFTLHTGAGVDSVVYNHTYIREIYMYSYPTGESLDGLITHSVTILTVI
jgi:hypothetical protein